MRCWMVVNGIDTGRGVHAYDPKMLPVPVGAILTVQNPLHHTLQIMRPVYPDFILICRLDRHFFVFNKVKPMVRSPPARITMFLYDNLSAFMASLFARREWRGYRMLKMKGIR